MRMMFLAGVMLFVFSAAASDQMQVVGQTESNTWSEDARFFMGFRGGVAVPAGGLGMAPNAGIEIGVHAPRGVGFGLHILGMANPPAIPSLGIQKTPFAFGAAADIRFYFQTVEPLTLYPTLSFGFVAGTEERSGQNVVIPLINPGFGARMNFDPMYFGFEIGAASFFIPYVTACVGYQFDRKPMNRRVAPIVQLEQPPTHRPVPVAPQTTIPKVMARRKVAPAAPEAPAPAPAQTAPVPADEDVGGWETPPTGL